MTREAIEALLGCELAIMVGEPPSGCLADVRLFYAIGEPSDVYICCLDDASGYDVPSDADCDVVFGIVSESLAKKGRTIGKLEDGVIEFLNPETGELEMIPHLKRYHATAIVGEDVINGYTI